MAKNSKNSKKATGQKNKKIIYVAPKSEKNKKSHRAEKIKIIFVAANSKNSKKATNKLQEYTDKISAKQPLIPNPQSVAERYM